MREGAVHMSGYSDTTTHIWEHHYEVRMPAIHIASEYELQLRHRIGSTGNKHLDEQIRTEWRHLYRTISEMVDAHKKGIPIEIVNYKDTESIYLAIQNHIENMAEAAKRQINVRQIPYDDLIAMDEFAQCVYKFAGPIVEESFNRHGLSDLFGIPNMNMFSSEPKPYEEPEERNSLADFFKQKAVQAGIIKKA